MFPHFIGIKQDLDFYYNNFKNDKKENQIKQTNGS